MTDYEGVWYLAQAPGPNIALAPNVLSIGTTDRFVIPSQNDWGNSWNQVWTALPGGNSTTVPATGTSSPAATSGSHNSLSAGGIAGIAVAVVAVCAVAAGVLTYFWRKKAKESAREVEEQAHMSNVPNVVDHTDGKWRRVEMATGIGHDRIELPGGNDKIDGPLELAG